MSIGGERISRNYKYQLLASSDTNRLDSIENEDHKNLQLQCLSKRQRSKSNELPRSTQNNDIIIIEKPIVTGESLTSISLKYRIPVPELKRVNKIEKDVEFYALSSVKIPVKTNSSLMDIINDDMQAAKNKPPNKVEPLVPKPTINNEPTVSMVEPELEEIIFDVSHSRRSNSDLSCSGADWDLSWWKVLLVAALFLFGAPFLYYMILF